MDVDVIQNIIKMLDETNELCHHFRMARDQFKNNDVLELKVELKVCRPQNGRDNRISASKDVAGLMVGGTYTTTANREIIVRPKIEGLQLVSYIHLKLMALQYHLLFSNHEDGYHKKIPSERVDPDSTKECDMISMKNYYAYRLQVRAHEGSNIY